MTAGHAQKSSGVENGVRALEPGFSRKQACTMVFSPEVAITIFSRLISPNLAVQPRFKFLLLTENTKGRTIRKVMGGGGGDGEKTKKKFMQGKMPRKKIRAKKKGKKKIHAEGRSNCDFYLIYKICQSAY